MCKQKKFSTSLQTFIILYVLCRELSKFNQVLFLKWVFLSVAENKVFLPAFIAHNPSKIHSCVCWTRKMFRIFFTFLSSNKNYSLAKNFSRNGNNFSLNASTKLKILSLNYEREENPARKGMEIMEKKFTIAFIHIIFKKCQHKVQ